MDKNQRNIFKTTKSVIKTNFVQSNGYRIYSDESKMVMDIDGVHRPANNMGINYKLYDDAGIVYDISRIGKPFDSHNVYRLSVNGVAVDLPARKLRRLCKIAAKKHEETLVDQIEDVLNDTDNLLVENRIDDDVEYMCAFHAGSRAECTASNLIFAFDEDDYLIYKGRSYVLRSPYVKYLKRLSEKRARATLNKQPSR